MPNNVKSCKKIDEKAQTAKFTVLQGEISSAVLKTWKTRETFFSEVFNPIGQVYNIQNAYAIKSATISK